MDLKKYFLLLVCAFSGMHIFFSCDEEPRRRLSEGQVDLTLFEDIDTTKPIIPNEIKPENRVARFDTLTPRFTNAVTDIFDTHLSVAYSLYYDDPARVKGATNLVMSYLSLTEDAFQNDESFIAGVPEEKLKKWPEYKEKIYILLRRIASTDDIAIQRKEFSLLSDVVLDLVNDFGITRSQGINIFFCQKALGGQGAYWLDRVENTSYMNPYFAMVTDSTQKFDSCRVDMKVIKTD